MIITRTSDGRQFKVRQDDGLLIRFLTDSGSGHAAGTEGKVSFPTAVSYVEKGIAEPVDEMA